MTATNRVARHLRGLFFGTLILSLAALGQAQSAGTGTISGRVINEATGEYLRNAVVSVVGTELSATTAFGGMYSLNGVPAGSVKLSVAYSGLDSASATVALAPGQTVTRDIGLTSALYDPNVVKLGTYVVTSQREGNARAIMDQQLAINLKKVIAADAMGNVSEGNVGEFLKLMPGVMMDYVEADTRAMRVRGLQPQYASVLLDGMSVANAGSSNIATGRAFEFEQLSISSVDRMELSKAPTPDQPSSVVGVVNLRTKGAFDRKGRVVNWNASLATNSYYADLNKSQGWDNTHHYKFLPNYSLDYSDVVFDGKLGIQAGFSRNFTIATQKHVWLMYNNFDNDFTNNATELPVVNRVWYQDGPKPTKRANYDLRLDYLVNSDLRVFLRYGFNDYDAKFYNRTLDLFPQTYAAGATKTSATVTTGQIFLDSNQYMQKKGQTAVLSGGAAYKRGDFTADFSAQYSHASNWYENTKLGHFTDFAAGLYGISWTMTRPGPGSDELFFTQTGGPSWSNPANYTFVDWRNVGSLAAGTGGQRIGWHERSGHDKVWQARLDLRNEFRPSFGPVTLKYGGMSTLNSRTIHRFGLLTTSIVGADGIAGTTDDNPANFVDTTFSPNWGAGGNLNGMPVLSPWKLYNLYRTSPTAFVDNWAQILQQHLQNNWNFTETINSGYAQANFKFGGLEVAPGVRYEATKSEGTGANVLSDAKAAAVSGSAAGTYNFIVAKYGGKVTGENTYSNSLAYVHSTYKFKKNLMLRASYHTAITRADIANLIPGVSAVDEANQIITASNPNLKPEKSNVANLSAEFYFEPVGLLTASLFTATVKDRQAPFTQILGADGYEGDKTYANWQVSWRNNIGNAIKYSGIEIDYSQQLNFLPGVFKGLGVFTNYTNIKYDDRAFYTGSPEQLANGGLTFTHRRIYTRLNANWVGKVLTNAGRSYNITTNVWAPSAPFATEYQAARLQLDLNAEYRYKPSLTFFVAVRNLLNEPSTYSYRGDNKDNFIRILRTGGIWSLGVRGTF